MARAAYSPAIQGLSGKAGSTIYTKGYSGPIAKAYVVGEDPHTAAQMAMRHWMALSAAAYRNLTVAQAGAWEVYAASVTRHNTATGKVYHPTAYNAFNALTVKFLQANGGGAVPVAPPGFAFVGDTLAVTAAGLSGSVKFTAGGANRANVTTEILLQGLPSPRRKPHPDKCRTKAFVPFSAGTLNFSVTVAPGWYAPAYRFVNAATGQMTPLFALPIVQVL